jgi:hypothetical protein
MKRLHRPGTILIGLSKMDGQNVSFVTLTAMVHFLNKICRPLACQGIAKAGKEEGYGV